MTDTILCPCNSGVPYAKCCEPLLNGKSIAATAEALMRSRYTAYVVRNVDYLLKTWHQSTRPAVINPETIPEWYGLHLVFIRHLAGIDFFNQQIKLPDLRTFFSSLYPILAKTLQVPPNQPGWRFHG